MWSLRQSLCLVGLRMLPTWTLSPVASIKMWTGPLAAGRQMVALPSCLARLEIVVWSGSHPLRKAGLTFATIARECETRRRRERHVWRSRRGRERRRSAETTRRTAAVEWGTGAVRRFRRRFPMPWRTDTFAPVADIHSDARELHALAWHSCRPWLAVVRGGIALHECRVARGSASSSSSTTGPRRGCSAVAGLVRCIRCWSAVLKTDAPEEAEGFSKLEGVGSTSQAGRDRALRASCPGVGPARRNSA
jgi:hypothetical protein